MDIKDELVLNDITWAEVDEIEYNNIGAFQNSDSNMPGYYIVWCTGNAYTLQEKYTCHAFNPRVIFPEDELFYTDKFMIPMRKTSYWYHDPYKAIHAMVKLKQDVMHDIELIQDNNTSNNLL